MRIDSRAIRNRLWRLYADARTRLSRQGSNRPALASFGDPDRSRPDDWTARLSDGHESYRRVNALTTGDISIICVSRRPHLVTQVVDNLRRQLGVEFEFIFLANSSDFGDDQLQSLVDQVPRATVIVEPKLSLGRCLNRGLRETSARFVAKFDDDDHYGPGYLSDSLRAHAYAGAGVVGKHTYYAHLAGTDQRVLRFPGHEFRYSASLAGGTFVIDRSRAGSLEFEDRSLGEDGAFLAACHRRGISTFAADRFNFVQHRGSDNTWSIQPDEFLVGSQIVDPSDDIHRVDR